MKLRAGELTHGHVSIPIIPETESSSLGLESIFGSEFRVLLPTGTSSGLINIKTNISFFFYFHFFSLWFYLNYIFLFISFLWVDRKIIYNVFIFLDISGCLKFHGPFRGTIGSMRSHTSELQSLTSQMEHSNTYSLTQLGISPVIKPVCVGVSRRDCAYKHVQNAKSECRRAE